MIQINNLEESQPYNTFYDLYKKAITNNVKCIDAILMASFHKINSEVNARYVNLKFIENNNWIFFTNYNSPKAQEFESHNQITAIFFWREINIQIRIKANIKKMDHIYNDEYFKTRQANKNALSISSDQSKQIDSYDKVLDNFNSVKSHSNLFQCPNYWGAYCFVPYYFEFWEGHESRINKREVFDKIDGVWKHSFLQP